ncbi:hypothetical protein CRJUMX02_20077 [Escherichia coli]|nr:hypothetical protein CRJUMX02_20077 [Escherichia coli]
MNHLANVAVLVVNQGDKELKHGTPPGHGYGQQRPDGMPEAGRALRAHWRR